jgi:tetratricopeptide (TPR) repeat protein
MREALRQALHLQFVQALETTAQLEEHQQPTLASRLTRGMIAYLQFHWQTQQAPAALETGHTLLQEVLEEGQKGLTAHSRDAQLLLFLGLAAVFDALLQQPQSVWQSLRLFAQGQTWLQQALITDATMADAHLGLGLLYFAGSELPSLLRRVWSSRRGQSTDAAVHHLQQAVTAGYFTRDVARTFLVHLYAEEKRHKDAMALGAALLEEFPENGYYAVLTGRSQCASGQYGQCASTLGKLAACLESSRAGLGRREERFDLYYYWGIALTETGQYDQAFQAFRHAINEDPSARRAKSLWARYHLATLYERRGQTVTARQIYQRLLRERNVEDLHQWVQQRLARLQ